MTNAIAVRRLALGLTQKQLARKMGLSEAAVSRMERRPIGDLPLRSLAKAAKALGTTPWRIVNGKQS